MNILLIRENLLKDKNTDKLRELNINITTIKANEFSAFQKSKEYHSFDFIVGATELKDLDMAKWPKLKIIQTISSGYDFLDYDSLHSNNVIVLNAKGVYSIPISEWVIGIIIAHYKKLPYFFENAKTKKWKPNYSIQELSNKKVLLFGTGSIGQEIVRRLTPFGCIIHGVNSNGRKVSGFSKCFSLKNSKEEVGNYDILIFGLPSNKETIDYVNKDMLKRLNDNAVVINVGRGTLINEKDLVEYMKLEISNLSFYLDVVNEEPLAKNNPLWDTPNIFISPHNSFASDQHMERLENLILENIEAFINSEKFVNKIK